MRLVAGDAPLARGALMRTVQRLSLPMPTLDRRVDAYIAKSAGKTFRAFPPSHRRAYVEWIAGTKRPETRKRRLATALDWLADGKPQNWQSQP
jgi:uncharacterized protein YdeI (YjbR/CyaY-like superfamily)